jgi:hypothetical protein
MQIEASMLAKSKEDLFYEIGLAVVDQSIGSKNKTRMDYVFDAMAWMSKKRVDFISVICGSSVVVTLREHERAANRLALAGAIADLICHCCGTAPVVLVSMLLADEGLHALCGPKCDGDNEAEKAEAKQ